MATQQANPICNEVIDQMNSFRPEQILFEDNHLIGINKRAGQLVQGDKTGDACLADEIKAFLKVKYNKPGNVFCGVIHRLDRPTSGIVLFAKTSKALERMNAQFREKQTDKSYVALVQGKLSKGESLRHDLKKNESKNKSFVVDSGKGKEARLSYKPIKQFDSYTLVEVNLETGRHHQIRCQLAHIGHPLRGDLKYGAKRSNDDGSICLHAAKLEFSHPITKEKLTLEAPLPNTKSWIQ
jgi:23S rRNA pseudouridine1911/1915/1917 synthase